MGLPGGAKGNESACQCRRRKRRGFDPWVGKIPWRRKRQPTLVFLPGEIPWTEEPGGLQSTGSQSVGHGLATEQQWSKYNNIILKIFLEIIKILFLFYVFLSFFFGLEEYWILAPAPGMEPLPSGLEGEVLTPGLPGKSPGRRVFNTETCENILSCCKGLGGGLSSST